MINSEFKTVKELIYLSYSNLAIAHSAVAKNQQKYGIINFKIRAKLFKGLKEGTMNIRTFFDDEKVKMQTGLICNYCGATENLSLDHIFPRKFGGEDNTENLLYVCKSCNSSKGKKDLMEWMSKNEKFLPLMVIRRYLKLTYNYCSDNFLLDKNIEELEYLNLPFNIKYIPTKFPKPSELILSY